MFEWFKKKKKINNDINEDSIINDKIDNSTSEDKIESKETQTSDEKGDNKEKGMFQRLFSGLNKTRKNFIYQINSIFSGNEINDEFYDELEEVLVMSDIGAKTTMTIIDLLKERLIDRNIRDTQTAKTTLKEIMVEVLNKNIKTNDLVLEPSPAVLMMVGVNGVGKTTTAGKLANHFKEAGKSVTLIAADTFRAAAIEQLEIWANRADVKLISQKEGADPASVVYDGLDFSLKNNIDITIIDTAGRLHNKVNLMNELWL